MNKNYADYFYDHDRGYDLGSSQHPSRRSLMSDLSTPPSKIFDSYGYAQTRETAPPVADYYIATMSSPQRSLSRDLDIRAMNQQYDRSTELSGGGIFGIKREPTIELMARDVSFPQQQQRDPYPAESPAMLGEYRTGASRQIPPLFYDNRESQKETRPLMDFASKNQPMSLSSVPTSRTWLDQPYPPQLANKRQQPSQLTESRNFFAAPDVFTKPNSDLMTRKRLSQANFDDPPYQKAPNLRPLFSSAGSNQQQQQSSISNMRLTPSGDFIQTSTRLTSSGDLIPINNQTETSNKQNLPVAIKLKKSLHVAGNKELWIETKTGAEFGSEPYFYNPFTLKVSYDRPPAKVASVVPQMELQKALDAQAASTLFVKDVGKNVDERALKQFFENYGSVLYFKKFSTKVGETYTLNFLLRVRNLKVHRNILASDPVFDGQKLTICDPEHRLFVAGLPEGTPFKHIAEFFNRELRSIGADAVFDAYCPLPYRQFCFLTFTGDDYGESSVKHFARKTNFMFNGVSITCAYTPPRPREPKEKVTVDRDLQKPAEVGEQSSVRAEAEEAPTSPENGVLQEKSETQILENLPKLQLESNEEYQPETTVKSAGENGTKSAVYGGGEEEKFKSLFDAKIIELSVQKERSKVRSLNAVEEETLFLMKVIYQTREQLSFEGEKRQLSTEEILEEMNAEFVKCAEDKLRNYLVIQKHIYQLCQAINNSSFDDVMVIKKENPVEAQDDGTDRSRQFGPTNGAVSEAGQDLIVDEPEAPEEAEVLSEG